MSFRIAALLLITFAPPSNALSAADGKTYWWKFANTDCGYDDLPANASDPESAARKCGKELAACEQICASLTACGGFNFPHGVMKKADCLSHRSASTVDLYVKGDTPDPPATPSNHPPIWPHPKSFTNGSATLLLAPDFVFNQDSPDEPTDASPTLAAAFARYKASIFSRRLPPATAAADDAAGGAAPARLRKLTVSVANASEAGPGMATDESYTLQVSSGGATITAATVYGAVYGLETFSQLVAYDFEQRAYAVASAPWSVTDAPRFAYRGLMVDTARHFFPVPTLRRLIDGMAASKLNAMHWHHEDDQSIPTEWRSVPKLTDPFDTQSRYTREDMEDIIEYARQRCVRVIFEFDVPGHADSWCKGYPKACPSPKCLTPLSPLPEADTWQVLEKLMDEVSGLKGAAEVHLGGDEVKPGCWEKTPAIVKWMNSTPAIGGNYTKAYNYFVNKAGDLARAKGLSVINWVEAWEQGKGGALDKSVVVHVWKSRSELAEVLESGYRAIISDASQWYLTGPHVTHLWQSFYENEPTSNLTAAQQKLLVGGEVCEWSEELDQANAVGSVFPRAAAVAEVLWSEIAVMSTAQAAPRLAAFRCLLGRRGVGASGLLSPANGLAPPPGADVGAGGKAASRYVISPAQPGGCRAQ